MLTLAYILFFLSSISSSLGSIFRKKFQCANGVSFKSNLFFCIINSIVSVIICAFVMLISGNFHKIDGTLVFFTALQATCLFIATFSGIIGSKYGSVAVFLMFSTLGTLCISSLYGILFRGELQFFSVYDVIAYVLLFTIIAISFIFSDNSVSNKKIFYLCAFLSFFANGFGLVSISLGKDFFPTINDFNYLGLSFFFLGIIAGTIFIIISLVNKNKVELQPFKPKLANSYSAMIASTFILLANAINVYLVGKIPVSIQSSLMFTITTISACIFDYLIYKVKINKVSGAQLILAIACSILFSF